MRYVNFLLTAIVHYPFSCQETDEKERMNVFVQVLNEENVIWYQLQLGKLLANVLTERFSRQHSESEEV